MSAPESPVEIAIDDQFALAETPQTYWSDVWRRFRKNKLAMVSLLAVVLLAVLSVAAPLVAPHGYDDQFIGGIRENPSRHFLFGTDNLGRDMFSRVIYGAQFSFRLALATVLVGTLVQMFIGGMAGWFGGWFDSLSMRLGDIIAAVPYIAMALAAVAIFGRSIWTIAAVLVVRGYPSGSRQIRSIVLQLRGQDYVEAARASGASNRRILVNHLLPNAMPLIVASAGTSVGAAIINESAYSFLGVGYQEPVPSWGLLLAGSRGDVTSAPHLFWFPAVAFVATITALLFVSEAFRDASDPKLRGA